MVRWVGATGPTGRFGRYRLLILTVVTVGVSIFQARAQELPPPEPPKALPSPDGGQTVLHATTNVVLVPTLVEKDHGDVVYGLKPTDFELTDNGVPQKLHVEEDMDTAPVALVVAVEQGRMAGLEFDKIAKLGPLLDLFLGDGKSEAALVGFDSKPHLVRDFTQSEADLTDDLRHFDPGDGGDAILDTISYAVDILRTQPKEYRRVLLLISEPREHGGSHIRPEKLVQRIGLSDVLVLSLTFSPSRAEFLHDVKDSGDQRTMSLISTLLMVTQALKKNIPKEIALMSGGEYAPFTRDKGFEDRIDEMSKHVRNRYMLSFTPTDPTPGLHTLHVRLTQDYGAHVVARENYWAAGDQ
ncbi:VWA domain-containing protein [Acidicapsa dinghuensis]|uniref:VWA domain-containing protein n=1 Tax=Acidicapsa dinghuensis TaxID=2218256 RepID=A0ABW1EHD7_9BACT|nr:VWA domain-containing protein [Acidicapsa dinghuensis]